MDASGSRSGLRYAEQLRHLVVEKTLPWFVGLDPLSVENKLRYGALAGIRDDLGCCAGCGLYVDFGVGDRVQVKKALGLSAIAAPVG